MAEIKMYLGRYQNGSAGLWVYSRNLLLGLLEELEKSTAASQISSLSVFYGGDSAMRSELEQSQGQSAPLRLSAMPRCFGRTVDSLIDNFCSWQHSDILHCTANQAPLFFQGKLVLTLHDLLQSRTEGCRDLWSMLKAHYYRFLLRRNFRSASLIITDHHSTVEEIRAEGYVGRIEVVLPSLSKIFEERSELERRNRFVCLVSKDKRKNFDRVLAAMCEDSLSEEPRKSLFVIASSEQIAEDLDHRLQATGLQYEVRFGLSLEELRKVYASSAGLLYPSLAEGFGYPVYEALSQGTPVLCSQGLIAEEMIERLTSAVVTVNPLDQQDIVRGIKHLSRLSISSEQREEVARYVADRLSMSRGARQVIELYRELHG